MHLIKFRYYRIGGWKRETVSEAGVALSQTTVMYLTDNQSVSCQQFFSLGKFREFNFETENSGNFILGRENAGNFFLQNLVETGKKMKWKITGLCFMRKRGKY